MVKRFTDVLLATLSPPSSSVSAHGGGAALTLISPETDDLVIVMVSGLPLEPRALELQGKLIDQGEKTPELYYNTGLLLQKSGKTDEAIKLYREAIAQRPNFAEALLNLGHALKAQGQQDEARNCWKQALDVKPELAQGYFEQAVN